MEQLTCPKLWWNEVDRMLHSRNHMWFDKKGSWGSWEKRAGVKLEKEDEASS